jgi:aspartate-semialdehyde dehydrogenase
MTPQEQDKGLRVAVIGATSLKGKELKAVLEERAFPASELRLLDDDETLGQLTEHEGEPTFVQSIRPETFEECDLLFFASTAGSFTRALWPQASASRAAVVDLSHGLVDVTEATMRIPFLGKEVGQPTKGGGRWFVVPHPVSIVLLTLWSRLSRAFRVRELVVNVFEPASERGAAGMEELREQTVGLLSFQQVPQAVFDAQVAFNLLVRYGSGSRIRLEETEEIIRQEVGRSAPDLAESLALRIIQVPVFHAHCLSVLVELDEPSDVAAVEQALQGEKVTVVAEGEAPAAAVGVAGRDEIVVGPVLRDRKRASDFWLWTAVDNLRLTAQTAVEIAEDIFS